MACFVCSTFFEASYLFPLIFNVLGLAIFMTLGALGAHGLFWDLYLVGDRDGKVKCMCECVDVREMMDIWHHYDAVLSH